MHLKEIGEAGPEDEWSMKKRRKFLGRQLCQLTLTELLQEILHV
jgi:hypothetical protein